MPPTVVPVRGQSTSNWASVTHALCQSSSPALACNVWHIAEPPTGLLSPCPAEAKETDSAGFCRILPDCPLCKRRGSVCLQAAQYVSVRECEDHSFWLKCWFTTFKISPNVTWSRVHDCTAERHQPLCVMRLQGHLSRAQDYSLYAMSVWY